jgi:hypothetical protein
MSQQIVKNCLFQGLQRYGSVIDKKSRTMKIRLFVKALAFALIASVFVSSPANAAVCPSSMVGAGTSGDPCQITTPAQLQAIASGLTLDYKLMNDLDMTGFAWNGIGGPSYSNPFTGKLDGNGSTIANLSEVESSRGYSGLLMNYVGSAGQIENLRMINLTYDIRADNTAYMGGIVGILQGAIVNSSFEGSVLIRESVDRRAGLIGGISGVGNGAITAVDNQIDLDGGGFGDQLSGFIGSYDSGATILASQYTGTISNTDPLFLDHAFSPSTSCNFITYSYYDNQVFGTRDSETCSAKGQTTTSLKSPTSATGIYANWTSYWNFGSSSEYPALTSFLSNPGAPTSVTGVAGDASVAVSWTAPANTGGRSISTYTVTSTPGGFTCSSSTSSCTVNGLTNGTSYSFAVTATTSFGTSSTSISSAAATPAAPSTPSQSTTTSGTTSTPASVSENVPAVKSANVKRNKKYSAKSVAKMLSISVPKKATVKVSVSSASKAAKTCSKSGTKVATKKKLGDCSVTVTVQPARIKGVKQAPQVTSGILAVK